MEEMEEMTVRVINNNYVRNHLSYHILEIHFLEFNLLDLPSS